MVPFGWPPGSLAPGFHGRRAMGPTTSNRFGGLIRSFKGFTLVWSPPGILVFLENPSVVVKGIIRSPVLVKDFTGT